MSDPKPEDFIVEIDGVSDETYLACPVEDCGWEKRVWRPTLAELLASAREHVDQVHDRCGAFGEFGVVGERWPYHCDRKRHNDLRHNWVVGR